MAPIDIEAFASSQLELLDRELQAELGETSQLASQSSLAALQRAGLALLNLHIGSQRTGLGGKTVFDLELDPAVGGGDLPEHGFRVGDIVGVKEQIGGSAKKKEKSEADQHTVEGVVIKVQAATISIAADKEDADVAASKLWLIKLANDVTYKRMNQTMQRLQKLTEAEQSTFVQVLFGKSSPTPLSDDGDISTAALSWYSDALNDPQKAAIKFAMASREIALIHGPPGTGKTTALIELILQLLKQGKRLLVCGPSNISVDNIVERLAPHKVPMVRLGHPARLLPSVLNHSLDVLTKTSDAAALVQDVRKEMDQKQASIRKTRNGRERKVIYGDIKELRKEYRERERGCIDNLVQGSKVVLATLHGSGGYQLRQAHFDVVIIDEASQALEASCWIPLLSAKKAVLAGDHLQLPPTVKSLNSKVDKTKGNKQRENKGGGNANDTSEEKCVDEDEDEGEGETRLAKKDKNHIDVKSAGKMESSSSERPSKATTLEVTLFDRLLSLHGTSIKRMLTVQYRMHDKINAFPSKELYESKLVADDSVKTRLLSQLPGVKATEDTTEPLIFYDTQGGDFPEKADEDDFEKKPRKTMAESKSNDLEAMLVASHVKKLTDAGLANDEIAVITPYNAQLSLLSQSLKELYSGIELGSVDGFQGREKEAVVVSLVRSNDAKEVGFLGEKRRLNVAMTRPRRHLVIIGDSETISSGNKYLKRWMQHLEVHADLRYPDPTDLLVA